jgi:hypothetical protein
LTQSTKNSEVNILTQWVKPILPHLVFFYRANPNTMFDSREGGKIDCGRKESRKPRCFHRLTSLTKRKERLLFIGSAAKKLSVQIWKESENWRCNLVKRQNTPCFWNTSHSTWEYTRQSQCTIPSRITHLAFQLLHLT